MKSHLLGSILVGHSSIFKEDLSNVTVVLASSSRITSAPRKPFARRKIQNIKLSSCAQSKVQTSVEYEVGTAPFPLQKKCEARSAMIACDQPLYYFVSINLLFLHPFVTKP